MSAVLVLAVLAVAFWWGATRLGEGDGDNNGFAGFWFAWAVGGPCAVLVLAAYGWAFG